MPGQAAVVLSPPRTAHLREEAPTLLLLSCRSPAPKETVIEVAAARWSAFRLAQCMSGTAAATAAAAGRPQRHRRAMPRPRNLRVLRPASRWASSQGGPAVSLFSAHALTVYTSACKGTIFLKNQFFLLNKYKLCLSHAVFYFSFGLWEGVVCAVRSKVASVGGGRSRWAREALRPSGPGGVVEGGTSRAGPSPVTSTPALPTSQMGRVGQTRGRMCPSVRHILSQQKIHQ